MQERVSKLIQRVVRRTYILASVQLAALLVIACNLRGMSEQEGIPLMLVAMAVGSGLAFFQLWGAGALAAMGRERKPGGAAVWLWHFRFLSTVLVSLQVIDALAALGEETGLGGAWKAAMMGVRLLLGAFWVVQAVDAHRALLLIDSNSSPEATGGTKPRVAVVYAVCLLLGVAASLGGTLLSRVDGRQVLAQFPALVGFYWAAVLSLHRRSVLGGAATLALAAALLGITEILGRHVHWALRVPEIFYSGSDGERLQHARVTEVFAVWNVAGAAVYGLLMAGLVVRSKVHHGVSEGRGSERGEERSKVRWLSALAALALAGGPCLLMLRLAQDNPLVWVALAYRGLVGLSVALGLAFGRRIRQRDRVVVLCVLAWLSITWQLPTEWAQQWHDRWGLFGGVVASLVMDGARLLPLIVLFLLVLRHGPSLKRATEPGTSRGGAAADNPLFGSEDAAHIPAVQRSLPRRLLVPGACVLAAAGLVIWLALPTQSRLVGRWAPALILWPDGSFHLTNLSDMREHEGVWAVRGLTLELLVKQSSSAFEAEGRKHATTHYVRRLAFMLGGNRLVIDGRLMVRTGGAESVAEDSPRQATWPKRPTPPSRFVEALHHDDTEGVRRELLRRPECARELTPDGCSTVAEAAFRGNIDVVELLLENGADPNGTNIHGVPAISLAIMNQHEEKAVEIVRVLVSRGADVNRSGPMDGGTPLHAAAARGHVAVYRQLLMLGADPEILDKHGHRAVLQ